MRAILPGRPQSTRQALTTAYWDDLRIVAYVSGNVAIIATGPHSILQTIYVDNVESLLAITIEESSGRIALSDKSRVFIYDPIGRDEGLLQWRQVHELTKENESFIVTSLSWSSAEELLVGGSSLLLWYLPDLSPPKIIWDQSLAYPTEIAYVSHDGSLVATCGRYDRLVKIWRRLSYEVDSTRFDVSYLPHPATVTNLHWRKPWHAEQNLDSLLYTLCSDNHIRVYAHSDLHALSILQPVADIDMNISIQPRRLSVGSVSKRRFAFVVDSRDFSHATEKAVQDASNDGIDHALEHLIEIANRSPEICIVLDGIGHMSVWGLENAGLKNKNPTVIFNIAVVDGMNIPLPKQENPMEDYYQFCVFAGGVRDSSLSLLVHSYAGGIDWYESQITGLFDTSLRQARARLVSSWTGHDGAIEKIVRSASGKHVCSWTEDRDIIVWKHSMDHHSAPLVPCSYYEGDDEIVDAIFSDGERCLVVLRTDNVEIMDFNELHVRRMAISPIAANKDAVHLMNLERLSTVADLRFGIIYDDRSIEIWSMDPGVMMNGNSTANSVLRQLKIFDEARITIDGRSGIILPTQEIGCSFSGRSTVSSSSYPACVIFKDGRLRGIELSYNPCQQKYDLSSTAEIFTNIMRPALASATAYGKIVVLAHSKTCIHIWDFKTGVCEATFSFGREEIVERFAWTSTPNGHLLLAVGFAFNIVLIGQARFQSTVSGDSWTLLQHVRMRDFSTHIIDDFCILDGGDILAGAGNQLFVLDAFAEQIDEINEKLRTRNGILERQYAIRVIESSNAALPIIHANFLHLLASLGRVRLLSRLLLSLHRHLKYYTEGDALSSTLDFDLGAIVTAIAHDSTAKMTIGAEGNVQNGVEHKMDIDITAIGSVVERLREQFVKHRLPNLTSRDQTRLSHTIGVVKELVTHQNALDDNALRYLHALHYHDRRDLPWSAIVFASLSTSQEVLTGLVTEFFDGKLTWEAARSSGLFLWLSDPEALKLQMENVARAEYTKHEDRNPVDCSLYYLALGKKNVLQGLWRMTIGIREKENTMKLLANNFNEPRWKATALKNAYALLSKRRFEYAAAFFLLAGSLKDAVNVCSQQLQDVQLAIAIAKVYDQEDDVVLRSVMEKTILPRSVDSDQGRWMASWAYNMLEQDDKSIQVLVRPVHEVVKLELGNFEGIPQSLTYRVNDPTLSILYVQLREKLYKQNRWRGVVTPSEEWDFVMRCVRYYVRMGCDVFALALVRGWNFIPENKPVERRGSLVIPVSEADKRPSVHETEVEKPLEKKKPPPTQFVEPSSNSLLDSFGF